jgi:hypothetical protein
VAALSPEEIDPLKSRRAQTVLAGLSKIIEPWPEVVEDKQFGSPVWRAGKKTFVWVHADRNGGAPKDAAGAAPKATGRGAGKRAQSRLQLYFWVGVAAQGLMTADERFEIPPYLGHTGWIALDVTADCHWPQVRGLALTSYRHFALRRMLKMLDED